MAAEVTHIEGYYLRIKYTTKEGKEKQKLRKLPKLFEQVSKLADALKAGEKRVFTTENGDDAEDQEDWEIIVESLQSSEKKYLDLYLEDENSNTKTNSQNIWRAMRNSASNPKRKQPQPQALFPVAAGSKRKLEVAPPAGKRVKLTERQKLKEEKRKSDSEKWTKVRESKTVPFEGTPDEGASQAGGLWFGQLCMVCLRPVAFSSLMGHLQGAKHQAEFKKCPLASTFIRKTPIIIAANEAGTYAEWIKQQQDAGFPVIYKCDSSQFVDLNCYKSDYKVLVLGEQDFSYGLGVAEYGCDVVATSYMEEHDPKVVDPIPSQLDDGAREVYQCKTLSSMDGDLEKNVKIAAENKVNIQYGIDATNMKETLSAKGVTGDYHCIVFPFPRYSLFRGNDPSNSLLVHGYFKSCLEDKMIQPGGIIQIVCLESQFREWDMYQIGEEAGLELKYMVYLDFNKIRPYQSRDLLGKVFSPKDVILCVWQAPHNLAEKVEKEETMEIDVTEKASKDDDTCEETSKQDVDVDTEKASEVQTESPAVTKENADEEKGENIANESEIEALSDQ